jgi:hypothetical protein
VKTRRKKKRRDKTIKLGRLPYRPDPSYRWHQRSLPFFLNPAGILIHRVHSVLDHLRHDGKLSHTSVHYLCNGSAGVKVGSEFLADPSKTGRLLCAACEAAAMVNGKPSADKLVGHHVHIGRVRAFQVCCQHERDRN